MQRALAFAENAILNGHRPARILAVNPEKVFALKKDPALLAFFRATDLLLPDGIGVVWAARKLRGVAVGRVPGADMMQELCGLAAKRGYPVYLLGASEEVNAKAAEVLAKRYPGLVVAGRRNGYSLDDGDEVVREINESGAAILFVALGSPRQEKWIAAHQRSLRVQVIQGIGGTLDVIAGKVPRAPLAFQKANLEWFYRLVREPKRIKRQVVLPVFAMSVYAEAVRQMFASPLHDEFVERDLAVAPRRVLLPAPAVERGETERVH